jgi:CheY-like chemotaxis protein
MRDTSRGGRWALGQDVTVGFDLYMTKPVEPSDLVRAVARLARR